MAPTHCAVPPPPRRPPTVHLPVPFLLLALQDKGGVIPALQRLSYGGKNLDDAQRSLEQ